MTIKIAPSILAADFSRLAEEVDAISAGGCDYVHVDVMDGRFVPSITIGQPVVAALHQATKTPLDVHLMIEDPGRYVESFAAAGAAIVTVHAEACVHLHRVVGAIHDAGAKAGVALNPATPLSAIEWILPDVEMILLMSVNPGFGGQRFIDSTLDKLRELRRMIDERSLDIDVEVDGGVIAENAEEIARAGANVLVSGSGVFRKGDYAAAISAIRRAAHIGLGN